MDNNELDLSKYGAVPVESNSGDLDLSKYGAVPVQEESTNPHSFGDDLYVKAAGSILPGMETVARATILPKKERTDTLETGGMMLGDVAGGALTKTKTGAVVGGGIGSALGTGYEKALESIENKKFRMDKNDIKDIATSTAKGGAYTLGGQVLGKVGEEAISSFGSFMKEVMPGTYSKLAKLPSVGTKLAIKYKDVLENKAWGTVDAIGDAVEKAHSVFSNAVEKFKGGKEAEAAISKAAIEQQSGLLQGALDSSVSKPMDKLAAGAAGVLDEAAQRYAEGSKSVVASSKQKIEEGFGKLSSQMEGRTARTKEELQLAKKKLGIFRDFEDPTMKETYRKLLKLDPNETKFIKPKGPSLDTPEFDRVAQDIVRGNLSGKIEREETISKLQDLRSKAANESDFAFADNYIKDLKAGKDLKDYPDRFFTKTVDLWRASGGLPKTTHVMNFAKMDFVLDYVKNNMDGLGVDKAARSLMAGREAAQSMADYADRANIKPDNAAAMRYYHKFQDALYGLPGFKEVLEKPMLASSASANAREMLADVMDKPESTYKFLKSVFDESPSVESAKKMAELTALERETGEPILNNLYKDYRKREAVLKSEFPMAKEYNQVIDYVRNNKDRMSPKTQEETLLAIQSSLSKVENLAKGKKAVVADDFARLQQEVVGDMFKDIPGYEALKDPLQETQMAMKMRDKLSPYIENPEEMNKFLKSTFSKIDSQETREVKAGLMALGKQMGKPDLLSQMYAEFQNREKALSAVFPFEKEFQTPGESEHFLEGLYRQVDLNNGDGRIARQQVKKLDTMPGMRRARVEAWKQFAARDFRPWLGPNISAWELRIIKSLPFAPLISLVNPKAGAMASGIAAAYAPVVAMRSPKVLGGVIRAGRLIGENIPAIGSGISAISSGAARTATGLLRGEDSTQ